MNLNVKVGKDSQGSILETEFLSTIVEAPFVLYVTGIVCSWTTEQERAELTQHLYDALLLVANQKLSNHTLQAIYTELG